MKTMGGGGGLNEWKDLISIRRQQQGGTSWCVCELFNVGGSVAAICVAEGYPQS